MITREQAREEFGKLKNQSERQNVVNILGFSKQRYFMTNCSTDFPYFFYSIHKQFFGSEEIKDDFLRIKDVNDFSTQVVYIISSYINNNRTKRT
jgi:hypothetical protein